MKKTLTSNLSLKLISLIAAFILWMVVVNTDEGEQHSSKKEEAPIEKSEDTEEVDEEVEEEVADEDDNEDTSSELAEKTRAELADLDDLDI